MNEAQQIIGACVRVFREQQGFSQETLAARANISYQYLSGIETGKENFSMQVLESLAKALGVPVKTLVLVAYDKTDMISAPCLEPNFFRPQVPLPEGLSVSHLEAAANLTQSMVHRINRNLKLEIGQPLQALL